MVTCEKCGSDGLELAQDLGDGRKEIECSACGHPPGAGHREGDKARRSPGRPYLDRIAAQGRPILESRSKMHPRGGRAGGRFGTPSENKPFLVGSIDDQGIVLLLGEQHASKLPWEVLEGALDLVRQRISLRIGGGFSVEGEPGTLDGYLKGHLKVFIASYVAVVMEKAGLVRINRDRPATVRLTREGQALMNSGG